MPELPEVETIRRGLEPLISGRVVAGVGVHFEGSVKHPSPAEFSCGLQDRKIEGMARRGKYLLILLSGEGRLVIHLGMTGALLWVRPPTRNTVHLRAVFYFSGSNDLYFYDPRKFGKMWLLKKGESLACLERLGPDWWEEVNWPVFIEGLERRKKSRIKPLLLDQCLFSGLGNIYVDEALYRARIHPGKRAGELTEGKKGELYRAVKETLSQGISAGGTSTRDYLNAGGERGRYQQKLKVYGKKGQPCGCCGAVIERIVLAGRGTCYCPGCQL